MNRSIAKFEKVSFEQFLKDMMDAFQEEGLTKEQVEYAYKSLQLPKRATTGSAGYDFYNTIECCLLPKNTIKIPTGVRCLMDENWVLQIYPRSGLGFKYQINLCNEVGIVDSDYSNSDNEGHIFIKLVNRGDKPVTIHFGEAFAQGIFLPYGITVDDDTDGIRNGGFGSTTGK